MRLAGTACRLEKVFAEDKPEIYDSDGCGLVRCFRTFSRIDVCFAKLLSCWSPTGASARVLAEVGGQNIAGIRPPRRSRDGRSAGPFKETGVYRGERRFASRESKVGQDVDVLIVQVRSVHIVEGYAFPPPRSITAPAAVSATWSSGLKPFLLIEMSATSSWTLKSVITS
jgi:hypothetical protein